MKRVLVLSLFLAAFSVVKGCLSARNHRQYLLGKANDGWVCMDIDFQRYGSGNDGYEREEWKAECYLVVYGWDYSVVKKKRIGAACTAVDGKSLGNLDDNYQKAWKEASRMPNFHPAEKTDEFDCGFTRDCSRAHTMADPLTCEMGLWVYPGIWLPIPPIRDANSIWGTYLTGDGKPENLGLFPERLERSWQVEVREYKVGKDWAFTIHFGIGQVQTMVNEDDSESYYPPGAEKSAGFTFPDAGHLHWPEVLHHGDGVDFTVWLLEKDHAQRTELFYASLSGGKRLYASAILNGGGIGLERGRG